MEKKERLIVALDVANLKEAEELVKKLSGVVTTFKVGKELFTSVGPEVLVGTMTLRVFAVAELI